jgi:hypothetical protein
MSDSSEMGGSEQAREGEGSRGVRGMVIGATVVLYAAALGLCGVLAARGESVVAMVGVLLVLTSAPIAMAMLFGGAGRGGGLTASASIGTGAGMIASRGGGEGLGEEVAALRESVDRLAAFAAMSDDAKRALNRAQEHEVLRGAIAEEMAAGNAQAARVIARVLEERYGVRAEARRGPTPRADVVAARVEGELGTSEAAVASVVRGEREGAAARTPEVAGAQRTLPELLLAVEGLLHQRRWDEALAEATRAQGAYAESPRAQALPERVRQSRLAFKAELERRFLLAAQEDRAEEALRVLAELDGYLTPEEAQPLREHARSVIGRARDSMGAQFRAAVQERRWGDALRLGDAIIQQFPNTRMAAEVRDLIEGVRQRAGEPVPAEG